MARGRCSGLAVTAVRRTNQEPRSLPAHVPVPGGMIPAPGQIDEGLGCLHTSEHTFPISHSAWTPPSHSWMSGVVSLTRTRTTL